LFKGTTVTDTVSIKYPKFRVFDIRNQAIWNYHQSTENLQLLAGGFQQLINEQSSYFVATPGFVSFDTCKTLRFLFPPGADPVADLVLRLADCEAPLGGDGERGLSDGYRAFPIASPFPDVVKFKSDIPLSFLWRLEMWYLVNPAVYIADNPTDTDDQTEDEDEYPEPEKGDGDGDGDEFPDSDAPDPDSDPRDNNGGEEEEYPPGTTVTIAVKHNCFRAGCVRGQPYTSHHTVGYFGSMDYSVEYIGSVVGCDGPQTAGGIRLIVPGGAPVEVIVLAEQQESPPEIVSKTINLP
jgi:hypothetical protein